MKNNALLLVLILFSVKLFSQDSKISFELNYPIPVGDNFIGKFYDGIVDIGIDYRFASLRPIRIGASINGGLLINNTFQNVTATSYTLQPRIFGELNLESIKKIRPSLAIGYTFMFLNASVLNTSESNTTQSGVNLNFGISYDITKNFFAQVQYDFIKLNGQDDIPDIKFNTNVNILKVGIGYKL